ncbi:MAG: hypothetical protein NC114_06545 [Ruminococcus flavefaciens]|nr:hypothetical protein [Ruminococcus flavefaciens]
MAASNLLTKAAVDPMSPDYLGIHMQKYVSDKKRERQWRKHAHKIFLYEPKVWEDSTKTSHALKQILRIQDHTLEDIEFNCKRIIEHFRTHYGDTSLWPYTLGQNIRFQVADDGDYFDLSLFRFLVNYSMLAIPIGCGVNLKNWTPWVPNQWTPALWEGRLNQYIRQARGHVNMRRLNECISLSKYIMILFCTKAGDRLGLSISNNEFIELMKRSEEAYKSITCTFDIPKNISPTDMEILTMDRTKKLLNFIGEQTDLSISVYARNGLFNPTQFREYAVHITFKPHLDGTTIPYTYPTNVIMGIKDERAAMVDAYGGRKAEITKLNVSDAGTLERALMMLMSPVKHVDINYECDSQHFRKRYISSVADLDKIEGRVICKNPDAPVEKQKYWIVDTTDIDLVGKTVFMKTPITCTHPDRDKGTICAACYGKLMAPLNRDVHIGRIAAADSADEIEQKLLSAKHALMTDTNRIGFDSIFDHFFQLGNGQIMLSPAMVEASGTIDSDVEHLFLEFYPNSMTKCLDGESRRYDRQFSEIIVYDDRDDSRINIAEENGAPLYLSPEFNDNHFLAKLHYWNGHDPIRIPFADLVDNGEIVTHVLFEYTYKNNELATPLLTLEDIMFNCETIREFSSYDECLDTLMPLFVKGGIHVPDYQTELLVSQLITNFDGYAVDWTLPAPEYMFNSINKSIQHFRAALISILYRESGAQIGGAYGTYDKIGTSDYDPFILSDPSIWA